MSQDPQETAFPYPFSAKRGQHEDSDNAFSIPGEEEQEKDSPVRDLEIKDAQIIFNSVWHELEESLGEDNLGFPKEIFWLNGAPGSGKGTHTRTAMQYRDFTETPIVVSELLKSPEARKRIDAGMLVGDREVTDLVFRALLEPRYQSGAVVDGYPRTKVQVECLKMLYTKLNELRAKHVDTLLAHRFHKPHFHILVLFIDEEESVRRQLLRGEKAMEHNREVDLSGVGEKKEVRKTDLEDAAARNRYRTFKEKTYEALQTLRDVFYYHYINAHGSIQEVRNRIIRELKYQSSLELEEATFDRISSIPLASSVVVHARQELVKRLDDYEQQDADLFGRVVELIRDKFMPIIERHAISGHAIVNSEDDVFDHPLAAAILIDIFSERGFQATVDIQREEIPDRIDAKTFKIQTRSKRVLRVHINFSGSAIRRG
ncbi:MAG: nucleoside monophosphate kinase [Verrucomicrobiota bacterium]